MTTAEDKLRALDRYEAGERILAEARAAIGLSPYHARFVAELERGDLPRVVFSARPTSSAGDRSS